MICSIVARPDSSAPCSMKSRSRPVFPQRSRSAARALAPSTGSLLGRSFSSSSAIGFSPQLRPHVHPPIKDTAQPVTLVLRPLRRLVVATADLVPVHDVPEGVDVLRPPVLVLEVVGVLPDVEAEDRRVATDERRVLVREAVDDQALADGHQPRPAAAEVVHSDGVKLALELLEGAEGVLDRLADGPARLAAAFAAQDGPPQRVIGVAATVVADRAPVVLGNLAEVAHQVLDRHVLEVVVGQLVQRCVQLVDVGLMVLGVVDLHRASVDVWLERVVRVGQRWQRVNPHLNTSSIVRADPLAPAVPSSPSGWLYLEPYPSRRLLTVWGEWFSPPRRAGAGPGRG